MHVISLGGNRWQWMEFFLIYLTLIRAKPIKTRSGSIVKLVTLWKRRNCDDWSSNAVFVGTPPPDDTWHAFLSGSAPSGSPQEDMWRASPIRSPSGRDTRHSQTSHPDDRHITSGRPTYPIRICLSGSLTKVNKSYYIISTAYHGPLSATCRAKGQKWWQVTSHDLWQPP